MKINTENIDNLSDYELDFICFLADYCSEEITPKRLRSRWSVDNAYRKAVTRDLQKELKEGTATEEDVEITIHAHHKPKKGALRFTMKDASVRGVKGRGSGIKDRRLNMALGRFLACLIEGLGIKKWEHISKIISSIQRDDGTHLFPFLDVGSIRSWWYKRKNIFKGQNLKTTVEMLHREFLKHKEGCHG